MKKYLGFGLIILGLFMLFKIIRISSFGFYSFGGFDTSAILFVFVIVTAILLVIFKNKITLWCFISSLALMVLSIILGTHLVFVYTSFLTVFLVFVPLVVGIALVIEAILKERKKKDE